MLSVARAWTGMVVGERRPGVADGRLGAGSRERDRHRFARAVLGRRWRLRGRGRELSGWAPNDLSSPEVPTDYRDRGVLGSG